MGRWLTTSYVPMKLEEPHTHSSHLCSVLWLQLPLYLPYSPTLPSAWGHGSVPKLPASQLQIHLLSLFPSQTISFSLCWTLRSANGCLQFCLMFNEAFWGIRLVPVHCLWELITAVLLTGVHGPALCLQALLPLLSWRGHTHSCMMQMCKCRGGNPANIFQWPIDIFCFSASKGINILIPNGGSLDCLEFSEPCQTKIPSYKAVVLNLWVETLWQTSNSKNICNMTHKNSKITGMK